MSKLKKIKHQFEKQLARVERDWVNEDAGNRHLEAAKERETRENAERLAKAVAAKPEAVEEVKEELQQGAAAQP